MFCTLAGAWGVNRVGWMTLNYLENRVTHKAASNQSYCRTTVLSLSVSTGRNGILRKLIYSLHGWCFKLHRVLVYCLMYIPLTSYERSKLSMTCCGWALVPWVWWTLSSPNLISPLTLKTSSYTSSISILFNRSSLLTPYFNSHSSNGPQRMFEFVFCADPPFFFKKKKIEEEKRNSRL